MQWKKWKTEDSIGRKFGRLTVVAGTDKRIRRHVAVLCKCDCGGEGTFNLSQIKAGRINSCGCLKKEASVKHIKIAHKLNFSNGFWSRDAKIGTAITIYRDRYSDGDVSFDDFLLLSQQNCFYCGTPPSLTHNTYNYPSKWKEYKEDRVRDGYFTYNGLDRIDSTRSHDKNNVVPCCSPCNTAKLDSTQEEFFLQTKRRYEYLVSKKLI